MSTPVTWDEVASGIESADFRMDNLRQRIRRVGDLWKPMLAARRRCRLEKFLDGGRHA